MVQSKAETNHDEEKWEISCKRLKGAGRKPLDNDMEELFDWIMDLRGHSCRVSRSMMREKGKTSYG